MCGGAGVSEEDAVVTPREATLRTQRYDSVMSIGDLRRHVLQRRFGADALDASE